MDQVLEPTAFELAVLQEVKTRFDIDSEIVSRDAGMPFVDLREIGCIGTAFVFKTGGSWKVLITPFDQSVCQAKTA